MRIVYMGTPDIAVPCLRLLAESKHEVVGVFTQPDRPKGRGHHTIPTPVKAAALEYNIPVYQPLSLRRGEDAEAAMETLRQLAPDLIVVMAYGQILPKAVLDLPPHHCINMHASLLPAYRGAAPIQWVILNGETKTGITAMQMAEGLDTGDMLLKKEIDIGSEETAAELHDRLAELAAETLQETLAALENGTLTAEPQDDALSSYASRITKEMSELDFTKPAAELHDLIRGITGFTMLDGKRLKVYASRVVEDVSGAPGTIADPAEFVVACGDGNGLRLTEIQPEGKRRMAAADFLRGKKLTNGETLG
ncbi:methionyl-tRNA formyltransferase [Ruminococcus sp.]|uniref:methionyl-tRNA formyltransferase n=1 Tax=Ruminococcus sp. TaxID=41978 RepID=UPI0025F9273F|nr:methionyl-tRNA formyltransferase [Ruminococcus sp.]